MQRCEVYTFVVVESFPFGVQIYNKLRVNKRELKLENFILQGL